MKSSLYILLFFLVVFTFFLVNYGSSEAFQNTRYDHGSGYRKWKGVNRWKSSGYKDNQWYGSWIYPSSANCSCPDNYDFVDNICISRDYPFEKIAPNCYI
jgi:hypothetical protein